MLHVWVIALFASIVIHDAMPRALMASPAPAWLSAVIMLGAMSLVAAFQHLVMHAASVQLRKTGLMRSFVLAERGIGATRLLAVVVHVVGVLVLGWLDVVRSVVGDLIMIDELLAMLPALVVMAAGWWSYYPIERQFREAMIMRDLDRGKTIYPIPTRGQWTVSNVRHQLLLSLLPLAMIGAWTEYSPRVLEWIEAATSGTAAGMWLRSEDTRGLLELAVHVGGGVVVFALTPLLMRYVWDTVKLGPGPIRERLLSMCRERGVRVRELLVWRTHGSMINGAVMGLAGPLRYVLLTDALLDQLPEDQVEAVMAHEIAHAKHAHLPWLAGSLIAGVGGVTAGGAYALLALEHALDLRHVPEWVMIVLNVAIQLGGMVLGVLIFGYVSRRFEWQADAFAARHMSESRGFGTSERIESAAISEAGAASMIAALDSVARLNHVPRDRGSFRHGSIGTRQGKLAKLVGVPVNRLPIDARVRWIKMGVLCAAMMVIASVLVEAWVAEAQSEKAEAATSHRVEGRP